MKTRGTSRRFSLERALTERKSSGHKLFVPYLTAGLPSPQRFVDLVGTLASGADAVEVGIPFSDPVMDGPVIQEASSRALEAGMTGKASLALIKETVRHTGARIVAMTYYNPIHRMGTREFARAAADAGVTGVIVPDLPLEEGGPLREALTAARIALVQMTAPTTPSGRLAALASASQGFVYAVSRLGVTGEREDVHEAARALVERIRPHTGLPVLLGIGISTPDQAREAASVADGVVVGSALVKKVLGGDTSGAARLASEMRAAIQGG